MSRLNLIKTPCTCVECLAHQRGMAINKFSQERIESDSNEMIKILQDHKDIETRRRLLNDVERRSRAAYEEMFEWLKRDIREELERRMGS